MVNEPWRPAARVKASAASALFEQIEFQYGPEERALKLGGTAELKFGARPRLDGVLSGGQLDIDRLVALAGAAAPRAARRHTRGGREFRRRAARARFRSRSVSAPTP